MRPWEGKGDEERVVRFKYPVGVRLLNRALSVKAASADELMSNAMRASGLSDFGDEFFIEPLERLLSDAYSHTDFHGVGSYLFKKKLTNNLINRLWAQYWIKREPILDQPLPPIVLVNGLQRTGTTFLQRLMGALPEMRGVDSWETVNPVSTDKSDSRAANMRMAKYAHTALNYINPEFKVIHSVSHDTLEEEVVLMDHSFVSTATSSVVDVPDYTLWVESQNQRPYYADLQMWIQFLLWRKPASTGGYLLLKSPHHMEHLEAFMDVFPDTKIIHTHRTPIKTMPSYCSMVRSGRKLFMPQTDTYEIGRYWMYKNKRFVDGCASYRDKVDNAHILDIAYDDVAQRPIDLLEQLYSFLNLSWSDDHAQLARAFHAHHRQNKYGLHHYEMSDYGLNEADIRATFGEYMAQYSEYL